MSNNPVDDDSREDLGNGQTTPQDNTANAGERVKQTQPTATDDDDDREDVLWTGGYSSKAMLGSWVLAGFVTLVLFIGVILTRPGSAGFWLAWIVLSGLLWLYFALLLAYRRMTVRYQLTSQRFLHEAGLLKRTTDRIEVIDIDDVTSEQRLLERIVGVGTIKIISSDRSHPELALRGIEDVKNVSTLIDNTRRKERRRRGIHIEAI